jgi:hypothetical protein
VSDTATIGDAVGDCDRNVIPTGREFATNVSAIDGGDRRSPARAYMSGNQSPNK